MVGAGWRVGVASEGLGDMKLLHHSRIVVVAEEVSGRSLKGLLSRVNLSRVTVVPSLEQARTLCMAGSVDACVVIVRNFMVDTPQAHSIETAAPPVPSVVLADVVTPDVRRAARQAGYAGVGAIQMQPRALYRLIGGALQKSRRQRGTGRSRVARVRQSGRGEPIRLKLLGAFPASAIDVGKMIAQGKIKLSS